MQNKVKLLKNNKSELLPNTKSQFMKCNTQFKQLFPYSRSLSWKVFTEKEQKGREIGVKFINENYKIVEIYICCKFKV